MRSAAPKSAAHLDERGLVLAEDIVREFGAGLGVPSRANLLEFSCCFSGYVGDIIIRPCLFPHAFQSTVLTQAGGMQARHSSFLKSGPSFRARILNAQVEEDLAKHPWVRFKRTVFGIVPHQSAGLIGSRLIHPASIFSRVNALISTFFLMYTALVVPVLIGFTWDEADPCWRNPLLEVDVIVDTFFILIIFTSFFTGVHKQGLYHDDLKFVAKHYAGTSLMLDLAGSIPVSYLELYALANCTEGESESSWNRFQRLIRIFRLLRLARVMKAMRTVDLSTFLERLLYISPIFARLLRVFFTIVSVMHCTACLFWMIKVESSDRETVREFLVGQGLEPDASMTAKYILSVYFVQAVFSTVGFGDISASNTNEQVLCIGIMLLGVIVFGALLAEVQAGLGEMRYFTKQKGVFLQRLKDFLRQKDISMELERQILDWVDFGFMVQQEENRMEDAVRFLSPSLRRRLDEQLLGDQLSNADFLNVNHPLEKELQRELWQKATTVIFPKNDVIMDSSHDCSFMLVIESGVVRVKDEDGRNVALMGRAECMADWSLLGLKDNNVAYGFPVVYVAEEHTHCVKITLASFEQTLRRFPRGLQDKVQQKRDFCFHVKRTMLDVADEKERQHTIIVNRWFHFISKATAVGRRKQRQGDATAGFFHRIQSFQDQANYEFNRARRPSVEAKPRYISTAGVEAHKPARLMKPPSRKDSKSSFGSMDDPRSGSKMVIAGEAAPWDDVPPSNPGSDPMSRQLPTPSSDPVTDSVDSGVKRFLPGKAAMSPSERSHGLDLDGGHADGGTRGLGGHRAASGAGGASEVLAMQGDIARLGSEMASLRGEVGQLSAGMETMLALLREQRGPRSDQTQPASATPNGSAARASKARVDAGLGFSPIFNGPAANESAPSDTVGDFGGALLKVESRNLP